MAGRLQRGREGLEISLTLSGRIDVHLRRCPFDPFPELLQLGMQRLKVFEGVSIWLISEKNVIVQF
jgi:hypothetical protein